MKTALITGAAGGIGRALCEGFRQAGYRVIATDQLAQSAGSVNIALDLGRLVADLGYRSQGVAAIVAALDGDGLDVLVNNAAIQLLGPVTELTIESFRLSQDVNVIAPFLLIQALLAALETAGGNVINIGSIHGRLTKPGFAAYATSKAALHGLTQALAVEIGARVRVNTIAPAAITTPMLLAGFADNPHGLAALKTYHPSGDIGRPAEVAQLALFLASDHARFINGGMFNVDGGIGSRLHDPV